MLPSLNKVFIIIIIIIIIVILLLLLLLLIIIIIIIRWTWSKSTTPWFESRHQFAEAVEISHTTWRGVRLVRETCDVSGNSCNTKWIFSI